MDKEITSAALKKNNTGFYYGYIILAISFLILFVTNGAQYSFAVFFKPMLSQFGWTRAATSGAYALFMILSGIFTVVAGKLSDHLGPRKVVTVGGFLFGLGYLITSQVNSLWQFYLAYGVLAAIGFSTMYIPLVAVLARWFEKRRGFISGIAVSGIGLGIAVVPIISSWLIERFNWRTSFLAVGAASLVLIVILAQFLRSRPETPAATNSENKAPIPDRKINFTFQQAIKTRPFWMMFIAWIFYGFFSQITLVHTVAYATDLGMTAVAAATILTSIGIIGIFGRISIGLISDKIGNRIIMIYCFIIMTAGYLGLTLVSQIWMIYAFAVIYGALSGIGMLLVPIMADYYGTENVGVISSPLLLAYSLGGTLGPPLAGGIFDATSSYQIAFFICVVLAVAASIFIWLMKPTLR